MTKAMTSESELEFLTAAELSTDCPHCDGLGYEQNDDDADERTYPCPMCDGTGEAR